MRVRILYACVALLAAAGVCWGQEAEEDAQQQRAAETRVYSAYELTEMCRRVASGYQPTADYGADSAAVGSVVAFWRSPDPALVPSWDAARRALLAVEREATPRSEEWGQGDAPEATSSLVGSVLGADATTIAFGLTDFMMSRFEEEMQAEFGEKLQKALTDSNARLIAELFPRTYALGAMAGSVAMARSALSGLKPAVVRDLADLPSSLISIAESDTLPRTWIGGRMNGSQRNSLRLLAPVSRAGVTIASGGEPLAAIAGLESAAEAVDTEDSAANSNVAGQIKEAMAILGLVASDLHVGRTNLPSRWRERAWQQVYLRLLVGRIKEIRGGAAASPLVDRLGTEKVRRVIEPLVSIVGRGLPRGDASDSAKVAWAVLVLRDVRTAVLQTLDLVPVRGGTDGDRVRRELGEAGEFLRIVLDINEAIVTRDYGAAAVSVVALARTRAGTRAREVLGTAALQPAPDASQSDADAVTSWVCAVVGATRASVGHGTALGQFDALRDSAEDALRRGHYGIAAFSLTRLISEARASPRSGSLVGALHFREPGGRPGLTEQDSNKRMEWIEATLAGIWRAACDSLAGAEQETDPDRLHIYREVHHLVVGARAALAKDDSLRLAVSLTSLVAAGRGEVFVEEEPGNAGRDSGDKVARLLIAMGRLASAETPEEVKDVIQAFAEPVGGYRRKSLGPYVALNGYFGYMGACERLHRQWSICTGLSVPVGIEIGWPCDSSRCGPCGSYGVLVTLINVGHLADFRTSNSVGGEEVRNTPSITLRQILALGGYLRVGFYKGVTFAVGGEYVPDARELTDATGETFHRNAWRIGGFLAWDIPILYLD